MQSTLRTVPHPTHRVARTGAVIRARSMSIAMRLGRMPRWAWVGAAIAAAWPSLVWTVRRFADGSDDPLGLVALIALGFALCVARRRFEHEPRVHGLVAAATVSLVATWPGLAMPDLVRALAATAGIVFALAAIVDEDEPFVPYAGLAVLALPLLSSLQFFAGFPLRVVTAEASRWLLIAAGSVVERMGTALVVDGRLVLVDAPCSGVRMAWVGWFTACVAAWCFRLSNRAALARMPVVGVVVLVGNVVRNTVLVAMEAAGNMPHRAHDAVGLVVLACVVFAIGSVFGRCTDRVRPVQRVRVAGRRDRPTPARPALVVVAASFVLATLVPFVPSGSKAAMPRHAIEYPNTFDDAPLVPVALSEVEERFVASFPGTIARFTNADRTVVLRDVDRPTRRLHPSADCYRASGYAIDDERLVKDAHATLWRCFVARRGVGLSVCERIVDANGLAFTDPSSWYWAAVFSKSVGPWRAMTVAAPLTSGTGR